MNRTLPSVISLCISHFSKLGKTRPKFSGIGNDSHFWLPKKNSAKVNNLFQSLVTTITLLFFVSFANAATITSVANGDWSSAATWNAIALTGKISTTLGSTTVTGTGTSFATELAVGSILYQNDGTTVIGTVASISNNTSLTLANNAPTTLSNIDYQAKIVPRATDDVVVASQVSVDVNESANNVVINSGGTLQVKDGIKFSVFGDITVNGTLNMPNTGNLSGILLVYKNFTNNGTTNFWKSTVVVAGNFTTTTTSMNTNGNLIIGGNYSGVITGSNPAIYPVNPNATDGLSGSTGEQVAGTLPPNIAPDNLLDLTNEVIYGGNCSFTVDIIRNESACSGSGVDFIVKTSGATSPTFQWQVNKNDGNGWVNITDAVLYSNFTTATLHINDVAGMNNFQYRAKVRVLSPTDCTKNGNPGVLTVKSSPVGGSIAGSTVVCSGTGATLSLSGHSGTVTKWQSSPSSTFASSVTDISNTTTSLIDTNVLVTTFYRAVVSNGTCSLNSAVATIGVNPGPTLTTVSQQGPVCSGFGASINLKGLWANSTSKIDYSIDGAAQTPVAGVVADGSGEASFTSAVLTAANNGKVLQITGIATTSSTPNCAGVFTKSTIISVNSPSVAPTGISGTTMICNGSSTVLTAIGGTLGTGATYQWGIGSVVGTAPISGEIAASITVTPASSTTYWVRIVNTASPCTAATGGVSQLVTVNPKQAASVSITASPSGAICAGTSVSFTAAPVNGGGAPTYQWKVNGATVGTNSSTFASSTLSSGDQVSVVMTSNASPCLTSSPATSNTVTMTVNPILAASVSITASPSGAICAGTSVSFTAVPVNGGGAPTYQWKVNGATVGTNSSTFASSTLFSGDQVSVIMTSNASPCLTSSPATSNTVTMTVSPILAASVSITASPSGAICAGTSVNFTAAPVNGGGAPTYQWKVNGATVGTNSSTFASSTLSSGDQVSVVMTSNASPCLAGNPADSNIVVMTVGTTPAAPVLSSVVLTCDQTTAAETWTSIPNSTDYRFDLSVDPNFATYVAGYQDFSIAATASPTVNMSGLIPGKTYYARARTVTACGASLPSGVVTISVPVTTKTSNGSAWSNGSPDATKRAVFDGNVTIDTPITACSCQINSSADVIVSNGVVLTLENGLDVITGGKLTFENNASLIQKNAAPGINSGNIVYIRQSPLTNNFDYIYWSSPVTGQTFKKLVPNTLADKYFRWGTTSWVNEQPLDPMLPAKGYIIRRPKPGNYPAPYAEAVPEKYAQKVQFVGVPNNGSLSSTINIPGQYNLIGNPYPSALDAVAFITTNIDQLEGTLYFWTHNTAVSTTGYASADYATFNLTGGSGTAPARSSGNKSVPSGYIAAGQSFFVLSKIGGNGTVNFDNTMRLDADTKLPLDNSQFFRGTKSKTTAFERSRVWLNLTNKGGAFKQMLVGYVSGASDFYDSAYDGKSFDGNSFVDFYSVNENKNWTIQGRAVPFDTKDQVPLGYKTTIAGTFDISIDQTDGKLTSQPIYIEDKLTNVIHNLKNGPYSFSTAKGTFNDRLVLRYSDKTQIDSSLGISDVTEKQKGVVVSVKSHKIKINSFDETIDKVMVYDLKGSLLYETNHVGVNEFTVPNFNSADQFLIVMTQLNNGKWVTKEIVF